MLFLASNAGSQGDFYNLLPADLLLYNVPVLLFLMSIMVVKSQFSKYAPLGFADVCCSASAVAYIPPSSSSPGSTNTLGDMGVPPAARLG
jgi:hypothetical protein